MKRNLLGLFAVVLAIAVSSFTVKKATNVYFVHITALGNQQDRDSYTETLTAQTFEFGGTVLDWFRITDADGNVSNAEFDAAFDALDTDNDNTLNDQAEISNVLDKK